MTAIWNGTQNTRFFKIQVFTFIWVGKKSQIKKKGVFLCISPPSSESAQGGNMFSG